MKIGLFGGSFNPVHTLHLSIAKEVKEFLNLDEVWFLPVFQPVHKSTNVLLPFEARLELLSAALEKEEGMVASEVEKKLGGPSYTIRTVTYLKQANPNHQFYFVIGGDSLHDLPTWRDHEMLVRKIPFAVFVRPGYSRDLRLPNPESIWVPFKASAISSSKIRKALGAGRLRNLPIPGPTMALIVSHNHYNCMQEPSHSIAGKIQKRVALLDKGLQDHVRQVSLLGAQYAAEMGEDPRWGYLAGMSHDIFRIAPEKTILEICRKAGIPLLRREREIPMLAHGSAAAAFLSLLPEKVPTAIIRAVRWHTFPKQRMGNIGKALVMADALDPSRQKPALDEIRMAQCSHSDRYLKVLRFKMERAAKKRGQVGEKQIPGSRHIEA